MIYRVDLLSIISIFLEIYYLYLTLTMNIFCFLLITGR